MNATDSVAESTPVEENTRAAIESFAAAFFFATMSNMVHGFGSQIAWPVVAFVRIVMTFIIAIIIIRVTHAPIIIIGTRALWWRSISGSIGVVCTFYVLTHMPVTDALVIIATSPIWVMVILAVVFGHRLPIMVLADALLAVAGVCVMQRPTFDAASFPILVACFVAFVSAVVKVSLRRCGELPTISVVAHHTFIASATTLVLSFIIVDQIILVENVSPWVWWLLIPVGIIGTIAQVLMTSAYGRGNTAMVALVGLSSIAFAAVFDVFFWKRSFDRWDAVGISMIGAAIVLSLSRPSRESAQATSIG